MQLFKMFVMASVLLSTIFVPVVAQANSCAIVVKLESAYLQNSPIYLDEIRSHPVVNHQLCLNSNDVIDNAQPYYLEFFTDDGLSLDTIVIFPEYLQQNVIRITTADLLINFCRQCNDLKQYRQFVNSPRVQDIAAEMDAIIALHPQAVMRDVIQQQFQSALLDLYQIGSEPLQAGIEVQQESSIQTDNTDMFDKVVVIDSAERKRLAAQANWLDKLVKAEAEVQLPHHFLPIYTGAELQSFIPEGLALERIASLPLATYRVDASAASVIHFYQSLYPDYESIKFGNFVVMVKDKQPFTGYRPEFMAIPHIVISEDPLGRGHTGLQIIYRPDDG